MTPEDVAESRNLHRNRHRDGRCWLCDGEYGSTLRDGHCEVTALCDALEAAWADRDEDKGYIEHLTQGWNAAYERAERAEAERDEATHRLTMNLLHDTEMHRQRERAERAEAELLSARVLLEGSTTRAERAETALSAANHSIERANEDYNRIAAERAKYLKRFRDADAALARVRALCDKADKGDPKEVKAVHVDRIRAAIEGGNQ